MHRKTINKHLWLFVYVLYKYLGLTSMNRKAKFTGLPDFFRKRKYKYSELFSETNVSILKYFRKRCIVSKKKKKISTWKNIMWGWTHPELRDVENEGEKFMCKRLLYSKRGKIGISKNCRGEGISVGVWGITSTNEAVTCVQD